MGICSTLCWLRYKMISETAVAINRNGWCQTGLKSTVEGVKKCLTQFHEVNACAARTKSNGDSRNLERMSHDLERLNSLNRERSSR